MHQSTCHKPPCTGFGAPPRVLFASALIFADSWHDPLTFGWGRVEGGGRGERLRKRVDGKAQADVSTEPDQSRVRCGSVIEPATVQLR